MRWFELAILALKLDCLVLCSDVLPSGLRWRNGLEFFHGLELCSALEMLLRSQCLTLLEPQLVVAALVDSPSFAKDGLILFRDVIFSVCGFMGIRHN